MKMAKKMMMLFLMIMMKGKMVKVMKMVPKMKKMRRRKLKFFSFELASGGMVSNQIILAFCSLHNTNKFFESAPFLCEFMKFVSLLAV